MKNLLSAIALAVSVTPAAAYAVDEFDRAAAHQQCKIDAAMDVFYFKTDEARANYAIASDSLRQLIDRNIRQIVTILDRAYRNDPGSMKLVVAAGVARSGLSADEARELYEGYIRCQELYRP